MQLREANRRDDGLTHILVHFLLHQLGLRLRLIVLLLARHHRLQLYLTLRKLGPAIGCHLYLQFFHETGGGHGRHLLL